VVVVVRFERVDRRRHDYGVDPGDGRNRGGHQRATTHSRRPSIG
jgi:hypothetical protein